MQHVFTAVALAAASLATAASATVTSLPASPPATWAIFGGGLGPSNIYVSQYLTPAGGSGGSVQHVTQNVDAVRKAKGYPCNGHARCSSIGTIDFQYALWTGRILRGFPTGRVGAALFGGFQPAAGVTDSFSFLQIYTDKFDPVGTIDGGTANGKTNDGIPRYVPNPTPTAIGWNYAGTAFDFFDIPFDYAAPASPPESVSFETALVDVLNGGALVNILADFTWGFSTLGGHLTGNPIAVQSAPSSALLSLYRAKYPGITYADAFAHPDAVAEPSAALLIMLAASGLAALRRRA